jgi:lipoprotein-releasing system permease protein
LFNSIERLISFRNLKPQKKEGFLKVISIFSFVGIMLGVAILIIVMSVMNGFRTDFTNKILGFNPHLTIKSYDIGISEKFKKDLFDKFKNIKTQKSFSSEAVIVLNDAVKGVLIKGVDINELEKNDFLRNNIVDGKIENFQNGTIIIGKELAFSLDLKVGNKINIMSSALINTPIGGIPKQESYKVSAIFNSGFYEFDQNVIFLNLSDALLFFEKDTKDVGLEIYLQNPLSAPKYKKEIELINPDYYIYSWEDLNKSFFSALKVERNVMFLILTLIIIVAAFNIISGLTILIKNKTKEIAILKTLGLSNKSITKSFFLTGFIIGLAATITGILLGIIFSIYIEEIRFFISTTFNLEIFPADIYFLDKMPSEINLNSIGLIFIFSLAITSLASYLPAKLISRMDTIKALKYE